MGKAVKRLATGVAIGALVTMIPGAGAYAAMALQGGMAATAVGAITGNKKLMQFGSDLSAIGGGMGLSNWAGMSAGMTDASNNAIQQQTWGNTLNGTQSPAPVVDRSTVDVAKTLESANAPTASVDAAPHAPGNLTKTMAETGNLPPGQSGIVQKAADPSWYDKFIPESRIGRDLMVQGTLGLVSGAINKKSEEEALAAVQREKDRVRNSNNDYTRLAYGGQYTRRY